MKRKKLGKFSACLLSAGLAAAMLAGCGQKAAGPEAGSEVTAESEESAEAEATTESGGKELSDSGESESHTDRGFSMTKGDAAFSFDEEGNCTGSYDLNEIAEITEADGQKLNDRCLGVYDGILYFEQWVTGEGVIGHDEIYAYDPENQWSVLVYDNMERMNISDFGYNDGVISFYVSEYGRANRLYSYRRAEDEFWYDAVESENTAVYENAEYSSLVRPEADLGDGGVNSETTLDEYGFLLIEDVDNGTYMISKDGAVSDVLDFSYRDYILGYSKDCIVFRDEVYDYCSFDIATGEKKQLKLQDGAEFLKFYHGRFYYYTDVSTMYDTPDLRIYSYDPKDDNEELILEVHHVPGYYHRFNPDVKFYNDMMFFDDLDGADGKIFCMKLDGSRTRKDTGAVWHHYGEYDYGTVEYVSNSTVCPVCGETLKGTYLEYPVFDAGKIQNADVINKDIKNKITEGVETEVIKAYDDPYVYGDTCGHDTEEFDRYLDTHFDETYLSGVTFLEDRYLCVNVSFDYDPGDSLPTSCQFVYDTETGKEISFYDDLYPGTEEDLRGLIAAKVQEDYESCLGSEYEIYDRSESAEDTYNLAYSELDVSSTFFLKEDGITYCPYTSGYNVFNDAYGYRNFDFTYEELLGRSTITP